MWLTQGKNCRQKSTFNLKKWPVKLQMKLIVRTLLRQWTPLCSAIYSPSKCFEIFQIEKITRFNKRSLHEQSAWFLTYTGGIDVNVICSIFRIVLNWLEGRMLKIQYRTRDITWPRGDAKFIFEFSTKLSKLKGGFESYIQIFLEVCQKLRLIMFIKIR